jgi:hypothetical protein
VHARPPTSPIGLLALALALASGASACGDGGGDARTGVTVAPGLTTAGPTTTAPATAAATTAPSASSPTSPTSPTSPGGGPAPTSEEVCALVSALRVGSALGGVDVVDAEPGSGTPQCSYTYSAPGGRSTNVVLAVMRPDEDLGGAVGAEGHQAAVDANVAAGTGGGPEEVASIGDRATWFAGPPAAVMVASRGDDVVTVSGTDVTQEQAGALAAMLLSALR